ncbi:hydantoinase/oxoprolinase family protein [Mycobacterium avium]|uniref:hydantoinase/oxoprolinase family protein n=1 Tax=Mycobacterium avium TaxID=1764 RepID=UPI001CC6155D|nr:hydantoinase/oxoprolinase family protein [Mycobacterium avium]MBZ4521801.1 hydantoinase/oxoprolinase family protein [Mycobacterium avium subsp. hominissuis]MBZ4531187.1 hydantoinase/oxoprolinase family protein [Mycobacterium avium subsp. hominissuis]
MVTRIGTDVGGTFTDLIEFDEDHGTITVGKAPSTPGAAERGVLDVVDDAAQESIKRADYFLHGTTVGLNALLERKGPTIGLITTAGFRDVLQIRRSSRYKSADVMWTPPEPLVERNLRLEVGGRVLSDGSIDRPLEVADVRRAAKVFLAQGVKSVAVALINSYANPAHEIQVEHELRLAGYHGDIALSHTVTGEYCEYERTSTAVVDAFIRPSVAGYFRSLESGLRDRGFDGDCLVTKSGVGAMFFDEAITRPFETVMSGPAAGVAGAVRLCADLGITQAITADVGGTSFDTSLVVDGRPQIKYEGEIIGFPLQAPWLDVRSIGAGGGSIARIEAGMLRVGPESAGAVPGPVSYGRGGTKPTVTDAAAVLGMLGEGELAGGLRLDVASARAAVEGLADELGMPVDKAAAGILRIASAAMAAAITELTTERGADPRDTAVIAFGGAGPLFGCLLAHELASRTLVVPNAAGNFSAWGLLCQDVTRSAARTFIRPLTDAGLGAAGECLAELFEELRQTTKSSARLGPCVQEVAADLRYAGQEHAITVDLPGDGDGHMAVSAAQVADVFSDRHERVFGHRLALPVEIVSLRASLRTPLPPVQPAGVVAAGTSRGPARSGHAYSFARNARVPFEIRDRASLEPGCRLEGPAVITEPTTTTYVDEGFLVTVHPSGALLITAEGAAR